ncbi:MAG: hypothetical protein ACLUD2_02890 [Clostridium sp.]
MHYPDVLVGEHCDRGTEVRQQRSCYAEAAADTKAADDSKTADSGKQQLPQITRPNPLTWLYRLPQAAT